MNEQAPYERPWRVASAADCNFYHSTVLPGVGLVEGQWDLRGREQEYLGGYAFAGRRVLEIGPASGALTFHMEREGAEVVAVELPMDRSFWNAVPYETLGLARRREGQWAACEEQFFEHIERIRRGFWFCHAAFASRARVHYGASDDLPEALGQFDVAVLAAVLLHCRSPVSVLEACARRVDGSIIVTEKLWPELGEGPVCSLVPTADNRAWDTWWQFTPCFFTQFLAVLGFSRHEVRFHRQQAFGQAVDMFTVIASRPPA